LAGLVVCYGITWAGIAGVSFPLFIMLLVPAREYIMPRFFTHQDLHHLDPLDLAHQVTTMLSTSLIHEEIEGSLMKECKDHE